MCRRMRLCRITSLVIILTSTVAAASDDLQAARQLLLRGRYEEATEKFNGLTTSIPRLLGQAACKIQQGEPRVALRMLEAFAAGSDQLDAEVWAQIGQLYFDFGEYEQAKRHIAQSLATDPNQPHALYVRAELLRTGGQIEQAAAIYENLSQLSAKDLDIDQALWIGLSKATHGRWSRDAQVFDRLVNEFYPKLLQQEPHYWPAHLQIGKLFLEKYNEPEALRAFHAALAINPRSADVHLALGLVALEAFDFEAADKHLTTATKMNASHPGVLRAQVDLALHNQQLELAHALLEQAKRVSASDERTLGRQFAVYLRRDLPVQSQQSRAAQLAKKIESRNPHCGEFYAAAAEAFEAMRIYPLAAKYFQRAIERLPKLQSERGKLGLVQMRLGEEAAARATLEEAFRADPFNVRVKNTLEVLDLLNRYAVIETEHFIIRFDRGQDQLLAEYASRYLEEIVYPDIVDSLGYRPQDKTLLEIFNRADGTSGHGWFSARMVGLPFIGTVGACAGKMFALTSPADGKSYNWARVLRHEFVHVVNLQQTNFQIPHWFTEALAVRHEDVGYPVEWDMILAKHVDSNQLFNLTNINHGFTRPGSSERWTLAYYQAYLYADYIVQRRSEAALANLIDQYAQGASTPVALQAVVGTSVEEFEAGYREFLSARVSAFIGKRTNRKSAEDWEKEVAESESDDVALAHLAQVRLKAGRLREARRLAEKSLATNKSNSLANGVMAQLLFSAGDDGRAWRFVEQGLHVGEPAPSLLQVAAHRALDEKKFERAKQYFRRGKQLQPQQPSWTRGLARVYLARGDEAQLVAVLQELADRDPDQITMARKLSQLTLRLGDFRSAEKWANRVIQVDVGNAGAHAELGQAYAGQGKLNEAIREYETALKLSPGEPEWRTELSRLKK